MSVGAPTTDDLFTPPSYPGANATAADGRRWLAWKVGIDLAGVARYADPNLLLRQAVENYGATAIAGRNPAGKVETLRDVFERACGPWDVPKLKKPAGTSKRWGRRA